MQKQDTQIQANTGGGDIDTNFDQPPSQIFLPKHLHKHLFKQAPYWGDSALRTLTMEEGMHYVCQKDEQGITRVKVHMKLI